MVVLVAFLLFLVDLTASNEDEYVELGYDIISKQIIAPGEQKKL